MASAASTTTLEETLKSKIAAILPHIASPSAVDDLEFVQGLLNAYHAYKAGDRKACLEQFAASVQHDSSIQVHPRSDSGFYEYLMESLSQASSLGLEPAAAAAATAHLIVTDCKALRLSDTQAQAQLDALAVQHPSVWWIQYAHATWRARHGDQRGAAEALTRAILAGGAPAGMYYSRARVYSYLGKQEQSGRDFLKFLELAPPDHRCLPDALYALALLAQDPQTARRRFMEAQAAEAHVAKWVAYTPSEVKMTAELLLGYGGR